MENQGKEKQIKWKKTWNAFFLCVMWKIEKTNNKRVSLQALFFHPSFLRPASFFSRFFLWCFLEDHVPFQAANKQIEFNWNYTQASYYTYTYLKYLTRFFLLDPPPPHQSCNKFYSKNHQITTAIYLSITMI